MKSFELTAAVTALANAIAERLSDGELALIASLFVQLGDTIATILAGHALREEQKENNG